METDRFEMLLNVLLGFIALMLLCLIGFAAYVVYATSPPANFSTKEDAGSYLYKHGILLEDGQGENWSLRVTQPYTNGTCLLVRSDLQKHEGTLIGGRCTY